KWFENRLNEGYVKWINPFNGKAYLISFEKARLFVFWSKNPQPIFPFLNTLDRKNLNYYFLFTLNDYDREKFEPNVPALEERIEIFKDLSVQIGREKVIWRFDPLLLTDEISVDELVKRVVSIGNRISMYTEKLVFSFARIGVYKKVLNNLKQSGINYIEFTDDKRLEFAEKISEYNRKNWGINIASCAEGIELEKYSILHNKCIDDELIIRLFKNDAKLMKFLGYDEAQDQGELFGNSILKSRKNSNNRLKLKDTGQRKECNCIKSKDIGQYNTCNHLCVYCYANTSSMVVKKNHERFDNNNESILL
ncbi:MAG: DUF1848 domain-containing protein, partial [Actinomycetia bacterium]|nr:DUF1848 domain-containing protein [Actinomycetes bacterium]